jgi:hypothetical protein
MQGKRNMSIIELPISMDYVPGWGLHEALRELLQNSTDRAKEGFKDVVTYDVEERVFMVGNRDTKLERNTLILGNTTKKDKSYIGKYGEGYKLAFIVLLRLGYKVIINNQDERWTPRIRKSKKFGCDILVVDIEKIISASKNLLIRIEGIAPEDYHGYINYNLNMQTEYSKEVVSKGEILLETRHQGMVFVGGLYVCTMQGENLFYGYNFNPGEIPLDRDRSSVRSFDLTWATSQMVADMKEGYDEKLIELLKEDAEDISYIMDHSDNEGRIKRVGRKAYDAFKEKNPGFIPVGSISDEEDIKKCYEGIKVRHVPEQLAKAMKKTEAYKVDLANFEEKIYISPRSILKNFLEDNRPYFTPMLAEKFSDELITKAENWEGDEYE